MLQEQLRQERAVLAGQAGDQSAAVRCAHARSLRFTGHSMIAAHQSEQLRIRSYR
jgi:hypothetical protein